MIIETGKIVAIEELQAETVVYVECISKSTCSTCNNNSSCGVGAVSAAFSDKKYNFSFPYKEGMKVDHFIELQISNGDLIKSASLIYLVPILFFISSALITKTFFSVSEIELIVISIFFTALGFIVTRYLAHKLFPNKLSKQLITTHING